MATLEEFRKRFGARKSEQAKKARQEVSPLVAKIRDGAATPKDSPAPLRGVAPVVHGAPGVMRGIRYREVTTDGRPDAILDFGRHKKAGAPDDQRKVSFLILHDRGYLKWIMEANGEKLRAGEPCFPGGLIKIIDHWLTRTTRL